MLPRQRARGNAGLSPPDHGARRERARVPARTPRRREMRRYDPRVRRWPPLPGTALRRAPPAGGHRLLTRSLAARRSSAPRTDGAGPPARAGETPRTPTAASGWGYPETLRAGP